MKVGLLKDLGSLALNSAVNRANKLAEYREKYESYSDEELKRAFRHKTGDERIAVIKVLKDRGYTASDLE